MGTNRSGSRRREKQRRQRREEARLSSDLHWMLRHLAVHELGHAMVMYALGYPIIRICVNLGDQSGAVNPEDTRIGDVNGWLAVIVAGNLANDLDGSSGACHDAARPARVADPVHAAETVPPAGPLPDRGAVLREY